MSMTRSTLIEFEDGTPPIKLTNLPGGNVELRIEAAGGETFDDADLVRIINRRQAGEIGAAFLSAAIFAALG